MPKTAPDHPARVKEVAGGSKVHPPPGNLLREQLLLRGFSSISAASCAPFVARAAVDYVQQRSLARAGGDNEDGDQEAMLDRGVIVTISQDIKGPPSKRLLEINLRICVLFIFKIKYFL